MSLTPYQIVVPALSILAMVYAWNLTLRQKKTVWEALLWTFFWSGTAFVALEPGFLTYLSAATGIKNQVNAIFVTSIGILFFMVFYIVIRLEEINHRQTKLIRALALRDAGLEEKGKSANKS